MGHAAGLPRDRRAAAAQLRAPIPRRRSWSTTSTSSSSRRSTPTAPRTRCTTSTRSAATWSNYCASNPTGNNDPSARNAWGVDLNRNFSRRLALRRLRRRRDAAAPATRSRARRSSPSPRSATSSTSRHVPEHQVRDERALLRRLLHVAAGRLQAAPRVTLPYPPYGTLNYFDQTASQVLDRIYNYRHTAILPQQTGPVADVLYSAAGNSADEAYYNHGIIGYDFEIGADEGPRRRARPQRHRLPAVLRRARHRRRHRHLQRQPRQRGPRRGHGVRQRQLRAARAPRCSTPTDTTAPTVGTSAAADGRTPIVLGQLHERRGVARSTTRTDGSTPTTASTEWKPNRPRELPDRARRSPPGTNAQVDRASTSRATSPRSSRSVLGRTDDDRHASAAPSRRRCALTLGAPATFGAFTPGVAKDYTAGTTATVISTAGDATLSSPTRARPHRHAGQRHVRAAAAAAGGLGTVKTWTAPTSNESVPVTFTQAIAPTTRSAPARTPRR